MIIIARTYFRTAQICTDGHIINGSMEDNPELNKNYCHLCSSKVISECSVCHTKIQGDYYGDYEIPFDIKSGKTETRQEIIHKLTEAPAYCYECGSPFPWTETRLQYGQNIVDSLDEISPELKKNFKELLPDIITESPRTEYATLIAAKIITSTQGYGYECLKSWLMKNAVQLVLAIIKNL